MEQAIKKAALWLLAAAWLSLTVAAWLRPPEELSYTERRPLEQLPALTVESLRSGSFMAVFEAYSMDQFPGREAFRRLKALVERYGLGKRDVGGIYLTQGMAAQLEYPLQEDSLEHGLQVLDGIYRRYLEESRVFVAIVPDKGYYLGQREGYPVMDYEALFQRVRQAMPYGQHIDLTPLLQAEDYYATDTHWRQERLLPVAERLCAALQIPAPEGLTQVAAQRPFYGVYYARAALPMKPDRLVMLQSPLLEGCRVYNYEQGSYGEIYDEGKLSGQDLYEVFLSGPVSLLRIENPAAQTDRELIIFRDSFGSSLAPLLVQGYKTVTLVDVRYVPSALLERFLEFKGQDVLFLYSTLVLNNSNMMK